MSDDKVNILLVDDQPAKLLTYRTILEDVGENLLSASNATEALELLLRHDVAVVLIDVYMPDIDGFQLAAMIRNHPRFEKTALIFISAILLTDVDRLRGYEMGAVDYVPVPVIPEVLRAKVKVFVELFRKTRQLEQLNKGLEARVAERTAALASSTLQLRQSERMRSLALAAGQMGSWEWNVARGSIVWDQGQCEIFGVDPSTFVPTLESIQPLINPEDFELLDRSFRKITKTTNTFQTEFRVLRPNGDVRWCTGTAAASFDEMGRPIWLSGVTSDITERKRAEERQILLAEEVDHRARNVVAVVQSIMRLTRADSIDDYIGALDGRIGALSNAHRLLAGSRWEGADLTRLVEEEFAPYRASGNERVKSRGPNVLLPPATAQTIALALHELVTNAAKYGALSVDPGYVELTWQTEPGKLELVWTESGGPQIGPPDRRGYGSRAIVAGIERQLGGLVNFDWQASGLRCTLCVPHEDTSDPSKRNVFKTHLDVPLQVASDVGDKRVLLVEDEPLVSMMLADMLSAFGHKVDGPYSRFSDAMLAAKTSNLQAGILDVNLGGEKTYAVADILTDRKIPFAFVTGYGPDSIVSAFSHAPVLQKPIEAAKLHALLQQIVR
ncbi:MAG TPA: response regulator [Pseudolabrys sp.]|jgi:PAS domain S-box-containing protein|nr:response regulator [Pseudolabrys sp.]